MNNSNITLDMVKKAQITRNNLVKLLSYPDMAGAISGCFVRVLLEVENKGEDYRIGLVLSVDHGQSYSGFTHDTSASTTLYLHLQLQGNLTGNNGSHYQLNSISNSPISQKEMDEWASECVMDVGALELAAAKVKAAQGIIEGLKRQKQQQQSQNSAVVDQNATLAPSNSTAFAPQNLGTTVIQRDIPSASNNNMSMSAADLDIPNRDILKRQVMEESKDKHSVFPKTFQHLTASQMRAVERELIDYLEKTRECITSNQPNCVVCMDRLPTIITLPCKHKVLCRLCATQVTYCPVCRESAVEMFEPVEI